MSVIVVLGMCGFVFGLLCHRHFKRAEASLRSERRTERRYQSLVEHSPVCIHELDRDGRLVSMNRAGLEMIGLSEEDEIIGTRYLDLIDRDDRPRIMQLMAEALDGHYREFQFTSRSLGLTFKSCFAPQWSADGKVGSLMGISEDITEQRLAQERVRKEQKMEALGTLSGGIAHDFNNMLGVIIGNVELLKRQLPENSKALKHAEFIREASDRAADLVKQILTFSRMDHAESAPMDMGSVVRESLKLIRSTTPAFVEIASEIEEGDHRVLGNPTQIQQVLFNLCSNATQAIAGESGRISVSLRRLPCEAVSADLGTSECVLLEVKDNGSGMSASVQERIFDPFFTTKEVGEGTGLGLAVVHGIVTKFGGQLQVMSEQGRGTSITALFPVVDEPLPQPSATPNRVGVRTGHILVVEDEEALREVYEEILTEAGFTVSSASNGTEALELYRRAPLSFDLVLSDYQMPGQSGRQLAGELLAINPKARIVLSSGYNESLKLRDPETAGVRAFLLKPVRPTELVKVLRANLPPVGRSTYERTIPDA